MWWFIFSLFHSQKDIHSLTLSFSHTSHHSILLLLTMMMLRNKYIIWKCVSTIIVNKEKTYFVWFENIYCNAWPDFMSNMPYFQLKEINVTTLRCLVEVCCWAVSREHLTITFVVETLDQWELNSWIMELFDVVTSCFAGNNLFNLDDLKKKTTFISFKKYIGIYEINGTYLDGMGTGTMTGCHVGVALCYCTTDCQVTVLSVHVVSSRTRIISQPDTEVLYSQWCLFVLTFHWNDFTSCLLELTQLTQKVPETRLGNDVIRSENVHLEQWGSWLLFGRQLTPDDFIFFQLKR